MLRVKEIKNVIHFHELQLDPSFPVDCREYEQTYRDFDICHFHNVLEIGICLSGEGTFYAIDREYPFCAGDVSFVLKGESHVAQSPDESPSQWVYLGVNVEKLFSSVDISLEPHISRLFYFSSTVPNIISGKEYEDVSSLMKMIVHEMQNQQQDYQGIVKSLLWTLFLKIARINDENVTERAKEGSVKQYQMIAPALKHICGHYSEEITMESLASLCFLSTTHFRRVFREVMNMTPYEYLSQIRVRMAAILLKSTEIPVMQIVFQTGHNSATSFDRNFKKLYRMTPIEYRRRSRFKKINNNQTREGEA